MNKKVIGIICVVIVVCAIGGIFLLNNNSNRTDEGNNEGNDTGSFNKTSITIKGYTIDIDSTEAGHPSGDSFFNTSFKLVNDDNTSYYQVDYMDIYVEKIVDYTTEPNEATINDKKFEYYLDESNWSADLYYELQDKRGKLYIKVSGGNVFSSDGSQLKTLATVDKEVIESKELAGILNFNVNN